MSIVMHRALLILFLVCHFQTYTPFFFFQAEDGIRDGHVTGVQTCALPISSSAPALQQSQAAIPVEAGPMVGHRGLRSEERREGKSVDLGGGGIIKRKKS